MKVLTVNCGSSTLKFDLVEVDAGADLAVTQVASGTVDRVGDEARTSLSTNGQTLTSDSPAHNHAEAFSVAVSLLEERGLVGGIEAVGFRVVHGGARFRNPVQVDDDVISAIEAASELAPLHNRPALAAIDGARGYFGSQIPIVATFDTAFYASLPDVAAVYALPKRMTERLGIRRYGFHGLAHRYMVERYRALRPDTRGPRLITLQLGNGCSATASIDGRAVDTSMGFTPLEGLIMGTRSGDIDPSLPLFLAAREGMSPEEVDSLLNKESGLLGLSGRSNDLRDLLEAAGAGDRACDLAVQAFCYRARKYIGAYLAALGGADAIVFGGGIGEHIAEVRSQICAGFEWAGLRIDTRLNEEAMGLEARISTDDSKLEAYVVPVREGVAIARDTYDCLAH